MTERIRPTWAGEVERLHELLVAQATRSAEPSVSAAIETTAKGEAKPDCKVYAPMGCDYEALSAHAEQVADIAKATYARLIG
jgi:hypothetical protein